MADRRRHAGPGVPGSRRQVAGEPQGDFAFQLEADEIGKGKPGGRCQDAARKDHPATRLVDAHQFLHHLGGDGDLGATWMPKAGRHEVFECCLRRVGLIERLRRQRRRQIGELGAAGVFVNQMARSGAGIKAHGLTPLAYP